MTSSCRARSCGLAIRGGSNRRGGAALDIVGQSARVGKYQDWRMWPRSPWPDLNPASQLKVLAVGAFFTGEIIEKGNFFG